MILGIDEVGRGPWAGPLVMGAVILGDAKIDGLTDSKKLTKMRRDTLDLEIRKQVAAFGLGWVSASELDDIGMSQALVLACRRAVEAVDTLGVAYDQIIIDGTINFLKDTSKGKFVTNMKKADSLIQSVSAASIIAKVARDNFMVEQAAIYQDYGFDRHVGYGTAAHIAAIEKYGVTPLHRLSFAPLQKYRQEPSIEKTAPENPHMTTRQMGDVSEAKASEELARRGHEIIERNWRTKYCEIDIVSRKGDTIYFTEVKHRKNSLSGSGIEAITPKKLNQMKFAAKLYVHANRLNDVNLGLLVIATTGDDAVVSDIIDIND